jgi:hypothetical protein
VEVKENEEQFSLEFFLDQGLEQLHSNNKNQTIQKKNSLRK